MDDTPQPPQAPYPESPPSFEEACESYPNLLALSFFAQQEKLEKNFKKEKNETHSTKQEHKKTGACTG